MEVRINKYLADHGICSRRGADKLIESGVVTINGSVAAIGQSVNDNDLVLVSGKPVKTQVDKVIIALYKPVGVTVSEKDSHAEKLITELIDYPDRLTYAGRLDKDSEGLILLTNDGDFINRIMRARNNHEKEYVVTLNKPVNNTHVERLAKGIFIKDLDRTTKPCSIEVIGKCSVKMILTEGLNRQIRRMWKICGYEVVRLKRVRVANIKLGELKPGKWRKIEGEELNALYTYLEMGE